MVKGSPDDSVDLQTLVKPYQMPSGATLAAQGDYPTIEDYVGETPLVRLQRLSSNSSNIILAKLEGNNPAGSVKDRCSTAAQLMHPCPVHGACDEYMPCLLPYALPQHIAAVLHTLQSARK